MTQVSAQPEKPKSRRPLIATIAVLAVIAAGLAVAIAFLVGRESDEPPAADGSTSTSTTTTLSPDALAALDEDELAALTNEVMAQVGAAASAVEEAAVDATATTETVEVVVSAEELDELVAYAEVLLDQYASANGSYAAAAAAELSAMETELAAISAATDEILALLESGTAPTPEVLDQIQAEAGELASLGSRLQSAVQQWEVQLGSIRDQIEAPDRPDVPAPERPQR